MRKIPEKLKQEILADSYYKKCARQNGDCDGRITWEHAWIYSGKQINEKWAIIPLCIFHHLGPGLNKNINQYISLSRATEADLSKYHRKDWDITRRYLASIMQQLAHVQPILTRNHFVEL